MRGLRGISSYIDDCIKRCHVLSFTEMELLSSKLKELEKEIEAKQLKWQSSAIVSAIIEGILGPEVKK